jgi:hypothetical protein
LQTKFAAETHLAEGQWLWEQQNVKKLRVFREGTRIPNIIIIIISTQRNIPEEDILHSHRCEKLKTVVNSEWSGSWPDAPQSEVELPPSPGTRPAELEGHFLLSSW